MSFWKIRNVANSGPGSTEDAKENGVSADGILDIDGEIVADAGWFTSESAVVARDFRKALDGLRNVTVRINSPGGDVMAGAEIYSALREHSMNGHGRVRVEITALAASAASVIAMAGDEIYMYPTAYMMIHNPWTAAVGDAREMRRAARTLDVISEGLINAYEQRTGKNRDELKRMLENETWMSAGTCVEEGFADGVIGAGEKAAACLMSGKSHGAAEILAKYAAIRGEKAEEAEKAEKAEKAEEEEKPNEEAPEDAKRSENTEAPGAPGRDADADPEEDEPGDAGKAERSENAENAEKPARDDEDDPDEDDPEAETDPEEEEEPEAEDDPDEEEPEAGDDTARKSRESRKKAEIVRRASAIAAWARTALMMMEVEE